VAATDTNSLYASGGLESGGIHRSGSPGSFVYNAISCSEDFPASGISFFSALRFANWLHNGQPTGAQDSSTTEDGAYTMIAESYPGTVTRQPGGHVLPHLRGRVVQGGVLRPRLDGLLRFPGGIRRADVLQLARAGC